MNGSTSRERHGGIFTSIISRHVEISLTWSKQYQVVVTRQYSIGLLDVERGLLALIVHNNKIPWLSFN